MYEIITYHEENIECLEHSNPASFASSSINNVYRVLEISSFLLQLNKELFYTRKRVISLCPCEL